MLTNILDYLVNAENSDEQTYLFINNLKLSLQIIDNKMDELKGRQ